jgi:hypothetical protein
MDMYSYHEGEVEEEGLAPLLDTRLSWGVPFKGGGKDVL